MCGRGGGELRQIELASSRVFHTPHPRAYVDPTLLVVQCRAHDVSCPHQFEHALKLGSIYHGEMTVEVVGSWPDRYTAHNHPYLTFSSICIASIIATTKQ